MILACCRSRGHGDVLRPKDGENPKPDAPTEARIAQPAEISLPAVVTGELDPEASAGTCNLLFSQGLHDKLISAEVQNASCDWRATSNIFVRGELLSVALDPDGCTAVRIQLQKHPSFSNWTSDTARPPFCLSGRLPAKLGCRNRGPISANPAQLGPLAHVQPSSLEASSRRSGRP